jgi:hypothetical protein
VRWHDCLKIMQKDLNESDDRHTQALNNLINKVEVLIISVNNHDVWTRAKERE